MGAYHTNPTSVRKLGTFEKGGTEPLSKRLPQKMWALSRVYSYLDHNPKHDNDLRKIK